MSQNDVKCATRNASDRKFATGIKLVRTLYGYRKHELCMVTENIYTQCRQMVIQMVLRVKV